MVDFLQNINYNFQKITGELQMGEITIQNLFLWFICYSILGWVYETILCSITQRKVVNRGFLNGPYCPIYGSGAVLDILVLGNIDNILVLFLSGVMLTCTLEYITSWAMEKLFHARWWDYSNKKFNLNGRVCLLGAVAFGSFSVILIKLLHPLLVKFLAIPGHFVLNIITVIALAIFIADCIVTIAGFSSFNGKLKTLSEELKEKAEKVADELTEKIQTSINETHIKRINLQERRMLKAFPKFKSVNYNETLEELKEHLKTFRKK